MVPLSFQSLLSLHFSPTLFLLLRHSVQEISPDSPRAEILGLANVALVLILIILLFLVLCPSSSKSELQFLLPLLFSVADFRLLLLPRLSQTVLRLSCDCFLSTTLLCQHRQKDIGIAANSTEMDAKTEKRAE
jgi:hypothetical protein